MIFRRSTIKDLEDILDIISQAQKYLKQAGVDQWQNGYPNRETIKGDIEAKSSYVLVTDNKIVATAAVSFDGEKTYKTIYEGCWLSGKPYAVIHRIAVESSIKGNGLASVIIEETKKLCYERGIDSIRVDTHENNLSMQNFLKKNAFKYCGIIYLEDGNKRLAFEKLL